MSPLSDESGSVPAWFLDAHAALPKPVRRDPGEDVPWSMPIILNIPKDPRPSRTALLEAAATAVVACCLDERAGVSGVDPAKVDPAKADPATADREHAAPEDTAAAAAAFRDGLRGWYGARIRKIARRARNVHWDRVQLLPGVTATVSGASARALVPGPVGDTDPVVGKLQIGGTELPAEEPAPVDMGADGGPPVIWVDADLGMTVGKAAAQVGHGSMLLAAVLDAGAAWRWARDGFPLLVREVPRAELPGDAEADVVVHDAGFTEISPGSATVRVTGGRYSRGRGQAAGAPGRQGPAA